MIESKGARIEIEGEMHPFSFSKNQLEEWKEREREREIRKGHRKQYWIYIATMHCLKMEPHKDNSNNTKKGCY